MLTLCAVVVAATFATADSDLAPSISYQVVSGQDSVAHVGMPYTFGTHDLLAKSIRGHVELRAGTMAFLSGGFSIPISAIDSGNRTLACHMREALGLDYSKSKFPNEHVCSEGQLPASGNDAIAFPEIRFECTGVRFIDDASKLAAGSSARLEVRGRWTIHGVARDQTMELLATPAGRPQHRQGILKLTGKTSIHLAAYGIRVKPALVIHAGDDASIDFNLLLAEKS